MIDREYLQEKKEEFRAEELGRLYKPPAWRVPPPEPDPVDSGFDEPEEQPTDT